MRYEVGGLPQTWVADPPLVRRDGELPPHLYPDERLCLFLPREREWESWMRLSGTIIPWAAEWLLHYELWLATGRWMGGGEHPSDSAPASPDTEGAA